mmetsp:Transcript_5465/g.18828  ORF Transcript_5465/g.18828 Transcript_5465/m.18828 type:complete len:213 (-) Transcript_5465:451-1089(-)
MSWEHEASAAQSSGAAGLRRRAPMMSRSASCISSPTRSIAPGIVWSSCRRASAACASARSLRRRAFAGLTCTALAYARAAHACARSSRCTGSCVSSAFASTRSKVPGAGVTASCDRMISPSVFHAVSRCPLPLAASAAASAASFSASAARVGAPPRASFRARWRSTTASPSSAGGCAGLASSASLWSASASVSSARLSARFPALVEANGPRD